MATSKSKLKFPDRRISETLLQFAEPLLKIFGPNMTEAQLKQALQIASAVWNSVVYADATGNRQKLEMFRVSLESAPQLKRFAETMIDRKRKLFGDDHRLIGEYKLLQKDGETRLQAEARDPYPNASQSHAVSTEKASKTSKPRAAKKANEYMNWKCARDTGAVGGIGSESQPTCCMDQGC